MAGEISKDDDLSVSKVYETLKSPNFLRDIYWEILSTMKEKNTYKNIRMALDKLMTQSMETVGNLGDSDADELTRKTIVCQICSLSYAVDTIFSKISFLKMEKAYKALIPSIVQELKNEGKITNDILSKLNNTTPVKEQQDLSQNSNLTNSPEKDKAETMSPRKRKQIETSPVRNNKKVCENLNGKISKAVSIEANTSKKKLGGRIKIFPQKSKSDASSCSKESTEQKASTSASSTVTAKASTIDLPQDSSLIDENEVHSDAESEISLGPLSSVSSVHTSDLSSFDDEISFSSGDEGDVQGRKKKRMSLKELERRFSMKKQSSLSIKQDDGKKSKSPMSQKTPKKKTPEKKTPEKNAPEKKEITKKLSSGDAASSILETVASPSSNEKELPKRTRKPNSKYSSDSILCPVVKVKERKKSSVPVKDADESNSSEELSPKKNSNKIVNHSVSIVKKEPDETQEIDVEQNNNDSNMKTPAKESDSSDLFKPQASARSLTSRRTAPLTLFST